MQHLYCLRQLRNFGVYTQIHIKLENCCEHVLTQNVMLLVSVYVIN